MKHIYKKCFFITLFFASCLFTQAQQKTYNFEGNGEEWDLNNSEQWSVSSTQAATGNLSIQYSISEDIAIENHAVRAIETGYTIQKVRTANNNGEEIIIGSDYDGLVLAIDYNGQLLWKDNPANGTMNHDIWCDDISGDGIDEIFVANANGHLYCYDINGNQLWDFIPYDSPHLTPMYAVCVVRDKDLTPYIVCGNYDSRCFYVSINGELVKELVSTSYSQVKPWGDDSTTPDDYKSNANFLRPIHLSDGSDLLVIHASNNHMQSNGDIYLLEPLAETAYHSILDLKTSHTIGDMRIVDPKGDGQQEIIYGTSTLNSSTYCRVVFTDQTYKESEVIRNDISRGLLGEVAYRVNQPFVVTNEDGTYNYAVLTANQLIFYPESGENTAELHLSGTYSYNDVWPTGDGKFLLASSQDGGSCIYSIDTRKENWEDDFEAIDPKGKIATIQENVAQVRANLTGFSKPSYQRAPVKVVGFEGNSLDIASTIEGSESLELFDDPWNGGTNQEPSWRSPLFDNNRFLDTRDGRNDYEWSAQDVIDYFTPSYEGNSGISTWGGHGNDPLYYSLDVLKTIASYGYDNGKKKTIYVFPEMNHHDNDFLFLLNNHLYPLAEHLQTIESKIALRSKDVFWQGQIYTPVWADVVSGKYADVFIPMLEETTDKTQDLSILGRMGLWLSGAFDSWGVRCSRDDSSFDRSRQFSSQKLANHFLRKTIYSLACGATYMHNAYMNPDHMSLALELLAKEALYVPKRNELVSLSPIHLSINSPQEEYIDEAENNKWTTYYDREEEESNPAVFSHMNGSWLGAALTPWDFSTYASGVIDRRQNSIPPYPHGQVLITPVQEGALADNEAERGKLVDKLHPLYKNIMKEYITDGVDYLSADGTQTFNATEYYTTIEKDIIDGEKKLPLTVKSSKGGNVGWVVAQMDPTHLRLTIVDGGFLNPSAKQVKVTFNTVTPVVMRDVLDGTQFDTSNKSDVVVDIPCGLFRFIDIELSQALN